tara:strand:- start:283 stop:495 length:213 start_codon:yes stop_codon:yes gene_type:complete
MKEFDITLLGKKIKVDFEHPKYVTARFMAQSCSWCVQGRWVPMSVSIEKDGYSLDALKKKIESQHDIIWY